MAINPSNNRLDGLGRLVFAFNRRILLVGLFVLAVVGVFFLRQIRSIDPEQIFTRLDTYSSVSPLLFILTYICLSVFMAPTLPLNIGAGMLWGVFWGSFYSILGATAGAGCAFLISRYLFGNWFKERFENKVWRWLTAEISKSGWRIVAFTRINPIFAFGPLNYFFGISPISFFVYFWATALFIAPPSILFAFAGHSMRDIALRGASHDLLNTLLIGSAAVTLLLGMRRFAKHWYRQIIHRQGH